MDGERNAAVSGEGQLCDDGVDAQKARHAQQMESSSAHKKRRFMWAAVLIKRERLSRHRSHVHVAMSRLGGAEVAARARANVWQSTNASASGSGRAVFHLVVPPLLSPPPLPAAMAELAAFTDYEKEFTLLTNSLPARINTLLNYESSSDNAQTELRRIKQEMSQSKQLAMDMEIAARGIAEPTRRELGNKIRIHKETLATLQKDLSAAEAKFDRSALLGTRAAAPLEYDKSQATRDRATEATDKLRKGTTQLGDAQRRLEETIDVGSGIMSELDRNRETLQRVRSNVSGTESGGTAGGGAAPSLAGGPCSAVISVGALQCATASSSLNAPPSRSCAPHSNRLARLAERSTPQDAFCEEWAAARSRTKLPSSFSRSS